MKKCVRCHSAHLQCVIIGNNTSCVRCTKMFFQCTFRAPLRAAAEVPTSVSSTTSSYCPPPTSPTSILPKWSHIFSTETNSSDRVRAASVAYLSKQPIHGTIANCRLRDVFVKKALKQDKFLSIVEASDIHAVLLTADEIRKEVIVFNGTASYPPPPIFPTPDVSIIIIIIIIIIIGTIIIGHIFIFPPFPVTLALSSHFLNIIYCHPCRGGVAFL